MHQIKKIAFILALLLSCSGGASEVDSFAEKLLSIQTQWSTINYTLKGDAQEEAFEQLILVSNAFVKNYPQRPEAWIWQGIVQSSFAGAKGGLGALSLAKDAKHSFEQAIAIDATALSGSAYTSLGTLYHKVPGWPIGFGDDDDAKLYLEKALAIDPNGIDINYFYGEYLLDEKMYEKAKIYLLKGKAAPARALRPLADKYRQEEIAVLLARVDKKLKQH